MTVCFVCGLEIKGTVQLKKFTKINRFWDIGDNVNHRFFSKVFEKCTTCIDKCRKCDKTYTRYYVDEKFYTLICEKCMDINLPYISHKNIPWSYHRLLLLGNRDKNSLLSILPKDIIQEILQNLIMYG